MSLPILIAGILLILATGLDAVWTALWIDGRAGLITRAHTKITARSVNRLVGSSHHFLRSLTGPTILVSTILVWCALLWIGWTAIFSADPLAIVDTRTGTPASLTQRIAFAGFMIFTMGSAQLQTSSAGWSVVAALAGSHGFVLIGLIISYVVSVLSAVVQKRSLASYAQAIGRSPEAFVIRTWNGHAFPGVELALTSLTEQINVASETHTVYPLLHYYHAARDMQSVPVGTAIFDEALTLFAFGVAPECRPAPAMLAAARESVEVFLNTMKSEEEGQEKQPPPAPALEKLRAAGIPTVTDAAFAEAVNDLAARRRLLLGFVRRSGRSWPGSTRE